MECKICGRERQINKNFKSASRIKICDECIDAFGLGDRKLREEVYDGMTQSLTRKLKSQVQQELPKIIEDLMVKSDLTFELTLR